MIERWIEETNERQLKRPVSPEAYSKWRNSTVTKRLFEDIELAVLDSFQDYLPEDNHSEAVMAAMLRQGGAKMAERVLDWAPTGCGVDEDED